MSDQEITTSPVNAGGPVSDIKKDRLGREKFVLNLASVIKEYSSAPSITFGLYGAWGSGKSSLLNFLVDELEKDDNLIVTRFNPWNFGDQHTLLKSFLRSFGEILGKGNKSQELKKASEAIALLAEIAETVKPISGVLKSWSKFLGKKSENLDQVDQIKNTVSTFLTASSKRIVVLIDDMDRLTAEEIRQMFQLVKAGADFDNVIYVLAFDRTIIARALDGVSNNDGDRYLEKVINVPLNVPPMTERKSRTILFEELSKYADRHVEYDWANNKRLQEILDIVPVHFGTFRLINLLINQLSIVEPLVKHDVDFTDHIAITMLKVIEPQVHDFIASHPRLFVDIIRDQLLRDKKIEDHEKICIAKMLTDNLRSFSEKECIAILSVIFPKIDYLFGTIGKRWGKREWIRAKRVCADIETFNRYFQFAVDDVDLSSNELSDLEQALQSRDKLENLMLSAQDPDKLSRTLNAISDIAEDTLSLDQIRVVIAVLMDIADSFPKRVGLDDMLFGAIMASVRLSRELLISIPDASVRAQIVLSVLSEKPRSVEMPITLVEMLTSSKAEQSQADAIFNAEDIAALKQAAAQLVRSKIEDGTFFRDGQSVRSLYAWLFRLEPDRSIEELRQIATRSDEIFLNTIGVFTNISLAESYSPVPMDLKTIRKIFGDQEMVDRLSNISKNQPGFKDQADRMVELYQMAKTREDSQSTINHE